MLVTKKFHKFLVLLTVFCSINSAHATKQLHFREGLVLGSYQGAGVADKNLTAGTLLDIELEFFNSNRTSWFLNTTFGMDYDANTVEYSYIGGGMNYYLFSKGMFFDYYEDGKGLKSYPKWRYYYGWQAGISSTVLKKIGEFLQINSFGYDFGVHAGVNRTIHEKWGVEFRASYDITAGFTSVSVGGWTAKVLLGLTYFI